MIRQSKTRLSTICAALLATAATLAPIEAALAQHVLNVRDADIRAFVADAARVTGRTFVVDGRVQGKVTVVTERPLSRAEYFEVFLSTLRANGLVAVPAPGPAIVATSTSPLPSGRNTSVSSSVRGNPSRL